MAGMILSVAASISLLLLSIYIFLRGRTFSNISLSVLAALLGLIELGDRYALYYAQSPLTWKHISISLESFVPVLLLVIGVTYGRQVSARSITPLWRLVTASALIFPGSLLFFSINDFVYSPDLQTERILFLSDPGYWFYIGMMFYCVLALINLESTFSATSGSDRWRMKFEFVGIASIISVLIFYFSQGLLYRIINMNLAPIRSGIFIIASALIGYSRVCRGNGVKVAVSRYVLYRSVTLLIVGCYLIALGLIGEGMRYFRIPFSMDLAVFFAFAAGIALLILLLSERIRRKVKVLLNKHLYQHKHDYREQWLRFTEKLSGCRVKGDVHTAVLSCFSEAFGLSGVSLYLAVKGRNSLFVNVAQLSMSQAPSHFMSTPGLLAYFTERDRVLNPLDNEYAPSSEEADCIRQADARLIVPLIFDRRVEGLVLFRKHLAGEEFNYEDYDLMKTLAKQAGQAIVSYRLAEELAESMEMAAVAKMSSFVIHDIKNLTYSLSLLVNNAESFMDNPDFQSDMIETLKNAVSKMRMLIGKLKPMPERDALNTASADVDLLVRDVIKDIMRMKPEAKIYYRGSPSFSLVDREEIKKVIFNLVLNALEAVGERGAVSIEADIIDKNVCLKVRDNGCGIRGDYLRNHIFKPFRTTKDKGLGIGLYQCKQIIEAHNGIITAESVAGEGAVFTVCLPAAESAEYMPSKDKYAVTERLI